MRRVLCGRWKPGPRTLTAAGIKGRQRRPRRHLKSIRVSTQLFDPSCLFGKGERDTSTVRKIRAWLCPPVTRLVRNQRDTQTIAMASDTHLQTMYIEPGGAPADATVVEMEPAPPELSDAEDFLLGTREPGSTPHALHDQFILHRHRSVNVGDGPVRRATVVGNIEKSTSFGSGDSEDDDSDGESVIGTAEADEMLANYRDHPRRFSSDAGQGGQPGSRLRQAVFMAIDKERAKKREQEAHTRKGLDLEFLEQWQRSNLKGGLPSPDDSSKSPTDVSYFRAKTKFQRRPGLPRIRFVLHSPNLSSPETSTTFSFSPALLAAQPWFWIDILNVTDSEMFMFSRVFGLHPLTAEDIIEGRIRSGSGATEGREKFESFPGYYLILVRALEPPDETAQEPEDELRGVSLHAVVGADRAGTRSGAAAGPQWILTFHSRPLPVISQVYSRLSSLEGYGMSTGTHWLAYALLHAVCDGFAPQVQATDAESTSIDDLVVELRRQSQEELLRSIIRTKKRVMSLLRLLAGKPSALKHARRRLLPFYSERGISELALYLSDIGDSVAGLLSNLQFQEQTLARAHGTYLARVNIEIQEASSESNNMSAKLTLIASVIVPLNLILGLWSVNVRVPWQTDGDPTDESYWPFFGFCMLCVVVGCVAFGIARWKKMF